MEHQPHGPWYAANLTAGVNLNTYRSLWRIWVPQVSGDGFEDNHKQQLEPEAFHKTRGRSRAVDPG